MSSTRDFYWAMFAVAGLAVACQKQKTEAAPAAPSASSSAASVATAPSSRPAEVPTSPTSSPSASAALLPDGRPVPELPDDAPTTVGLGVVLVTYRGAENAAASAPAKDAALARARELVGEAVKDFGDAVKKGDRGSVEDLGTIPRGVLDPAAEYALFTLKKGDVYREPIDTPRGYWVARRLR